MADLIERDAVLGTFEEMLDTPDYDVIARCYSEADVQKAIQAFKDIPAANSWIPCSERLPEPNEFVLYVWRSKNGNVAVLHGWHFENRVENAWHQSGIGMSRPNEEVTHWMPLPEPPEKE